MKKRLITNLQQTVHSIITNVIKKKSQPEEDISNGTRTKLKKKRVRKKRRIKGSQTESKPVDINSDDTTSFDIEKLVAEHKLWSVSDFLIPESDNELRFHDLDLDDRILHAVADLKFRYCTPIQAQILPVTLKGRDATGQAQTGTGKTIAFLITIFTHLLRNPIEGKRKNGTPRALIISPTRELALQIEKEAQQLAKYCNINTQCIIGGIDYKLQKKRLNNEIVDVVVATPGRLIDFRRHHDIHFRSVEIFVIDEADRMLDMGFIPDVTKIVHWLPSRKSRQTLLFSATMLPEIKSISERWTQDAHVVEVNPDEIAADSVDQNVYIVTANEKYVLLYNILSGEKSDSILVFSNRRDEAQKLTDKLTNDGFNCALLSGAVPQNKRIKTLENFRNKNIRVLVATDVAGRGLHVENIGLVVNYNLPEDPEDYVHRIGRTGRAGSEGTSISFACEDESFSIPKIEEFLGHNLSCVHPAEEQLNLPEK